MIRIGMAKALAYIVIPIVFAFFDRINMRLNRHNIGFNIGFHIGVFGWDVDLRGITKYNAWIRVNMQLAGFMHTSVHHEVRWIRKVSPNAFLPIS